MHVTPAPAAPAPFDVLNVKKLKNELQLNYYIHSEIRLY